jgi:membrane associated rhomboid family serine protease
VTITIPMWLVWALAVPVAGFMVFVAATLFGILSGIAADVERNERLATPPQPAPLATSTTSETEQGRG